MIGVVCGDGYRVAYMVDLMGVVGGIKLVLMGGGGGGGIGSADGVVHGGTFRVW